MSKVYDQASFHMQRGKNIDTALMTIKAAIQWASNKQLLSKAGVERITKMADDPRMDGPNTNITSDDLSPVGQKVFDNSYNQWLVQVMKSNYRDFSTDILDKALSRLSGWGSANKDSVPATQKEPATANDTQITNKEKFAGKEGVMNMEKFKIPVRMVEAEEPPILVDPDGPPVEGDPIKDIINGKQKEEEEIKEDCAVIHICVKLVDKDDESKINKPVTPPADMIITDEGEPVVQKVIESKK